MHEAALLIAVNSKNEVLLQHKDGGAPRWANQWCLFGGGVEPGESPEQAIKRELAEELEWQLAGYEHFITVEDDEAQRHGFIVQSDKTAEELRATQHEGDDLGYFSKKELAKMDIPTPHRKILDSFFARHVSQSNKERGQL